MTRFSWFKFDFTEWRDMSDTLSEIERGVYVELLCVLAMSLPSSTVTLSADAWSRRLRLGPRTPLQAVLHNLADQDLINLDDADESKISVSVPWLVEGYRKRARDSERHLRNAPSGGDGTVRQEKAEGSSTSNKKVPDTAAGTVQPPAPETVSDNREDQKKRENTSSPSATVAASAAPPVSKRSKIPRAKNPLWEQADKVLAHYATKHPDYKPDDAGHTLVIKHLRNYSVEDLCRAIDGAHESEWHRENGALGLGVILGTSEQITKFVEIARSSSTEEESGDVVADKVAAGLPLNPEQREKAIRRGLLPHDGVDKNVTSSNGATP
jgi:hypothetical protein